MNALTNKPMESKEREQRQNKKRVSTEMTDAAALRKKRMENHMRVTKAKGKEKTRVKTKMIEGVKIRQKRASKEGIDEENIEMLCVHTRVLLRLEQERREKMRNELWVVGLPVEDKAQVELLRDGAAG